MLFFLGYSETLFEVLENVVDFKEYKFILGEVDGIYFILDLKVKSLLVELVGFKFARPAHVGVDGPVLAEVLQLLILHEVVEAIQIGASRAKEITGLLQELVLAHESGVELVSAEVFDKVLLAEVISEFFELAHGLVPHFLRKLNVLVDPPRLVLEQARLRLELVAQLHELLLVPGHLLMKLLLLAESWLVGLLHLRHGRAISVKPRVVIRGRSILEGVVIQNLRVVLLQLLDVRLALDLI